MEMTAEEAYALAQISKRFTYHDAVRFAVRHDGGKQREHILEATGALYRALGDALGFHPR
jgi:hypothetical protein